MSFVWTVLGAGSILPRAGYGCSGYALRREGSSAFTLFDCGPGTLRSLGQAGFDLADLERVVLTHFHPDHCLDLLALAFARRNPDLRSRLRHRLEVVGPTGLAALLDRAGALFGDRGWTRFEDVDVTEVDPRAGGTFERTGADGARLRFAWRATRHTPESVAWRVTEALGARATATSTSAIAAERSEGASIAYTGDTGENPDVAELARDVDLFVCECSFDEAHAAEHHLTPESAGRLAARARARALLLTHFYPGLDPTVAREAAARVYAGAIELARDGSVHRVDA